MTNSFGFSGTNRGISASIVTSSYGRCDGSSYGVFAQFIANDCLGISDTGIGLSAAIAIGCIGTNSSGPSVNATNRYNMP